jgi:hypothetical protein
MDALPLALPLHRFIVAVDVEGSTTRTNPAKGRLRAVMYELFQATMRLSGISKDLHDPLFDRGDGAMLLIHPVDELPKTLLLNTFIPALSLLLTEHNKKSPETGFRLRCAVHAGDAHFDRWGVFGEAIDLTCRLLDAPELKAKLAETTAPLVLVVSDDIHRWVVSQGYDGIDGVSFEPLVWVRVRERRHRGWVHVPPVPAIPRQGRHHQFGELQQG